MMKKTTLLIAILLILAIPFSYAVVVSGTSSSYTFQIFNCTSDKINQTIGCNAETIKFECDIYDPSFIDNVKFRIDGTTYLTGQTFGNPAHFYYYYNKPADISSSNVPITMDRQTITDIALNGLNAYQLVQVNHDCTTCPATYNNTAITSCQIDNSYTLQHISSNETCSPSYNTTEYCNYCTQNIIANYTSCDTNGSRMVSFTDLNYSTCCLMTGLTEDCMINTAPYSTHNESCNYYTNQFTCTLDNQPVLNDKINVNCEVPTSEETCCVVNIYQGLNLTDLLQTSPEYKNKGSSAIFPIEQETRTCFAPTNRLLNAYYTRKELRADTPYKLEVKCTSQNTTLLSQYQITPQYHNYDFWFQRWNWITNNPATLFGSFAMVFVLILFIAWAVKKVRYG